MSKVTEQPPREPVRQAVLVPRDWDDFFHGWEVQDDHGYHLGLIGEYHEPLRFRAYGVRNVLGLGDGPIAVEAEFSSRDEAEEWVVDGFPEAEA